jgi:hypothetical protein
MRFTFPARKDKSLGRPGWHVEIKLEGQLVAEVWCPGTKREALKEARITAEAYGYVDGAQ